MSRDHINQVTPMSNISQRREQHDERKQTKASSDIEMPKLGRRNHQKSLRRSREHVYRADTVWTSSRHDSHKRSNDVISGRRVFILSSPFPVPGQTGGKSKRKPKGQLTKDVKW